MKVTHVVKVVIPVTLCLLLLPAVVCAVSIIYFVDGTSTQGDIRKGDNEEYLITRENGKWEIVPASDIKAIRNGNEMVYVNNSLPAENADAVQEQTQETQQKKIDVSGQYKDKIYLDDGQILTGKIVAQNPDAVTIVSESGQRDEINTKYIKRISKADNQPVLNTSVPARTDMGRDTDNSQSSFYSRTKKNKTEEFSIKVGPNVMGRHMVEDGSVYYDGYTYEFSGTEDVNVGISLSGEYANFVEKNIGLGVGITYQLPRKQSNVDGNFNFMPIYALAKFRTLPDSRGRYFYGVTQLGYNIFSGDTVYKGTSGKLTGGLYTGFGCGYFADGVIFELLYSIHRGSLKGSGTVLDYGYYGYYYAYFEQKANITYSCLTISCGVKF